MSSISSQGTLFQIGDGASPNVFTTIPQVTNLNGPDGSSTEINTTSLSSTAHEFILGLKDEGSVSADMIWDERDTQHSALRTLFSNGTSQTFRITDSGSPLVTYTFLAYVQQLSVTMGVDEVNRATVNFRISGSMEVA